MDAIIKSCEEMVRDMKRGKIVGSYPCAHATGELLRLVVNTRWSNAKDLITKIKIVGDMLVESKPEELVIGNIIRRVLFIVREEYTQLQDAKAAHDDTRVTDSVKRTSTTSMYSILEEQAEEKYEDFHESLKAEILEEVLALMEEIGTSYENVSEQAIEHIHANEVIMTFGRSRTVEAFLKEAYGKGKRRNFQCIVTEAAPSCNGREMAKILAEEGIETTLIPDSAIYAMMARVNKVIVGTHSVMANGGLLAQAGTHLLAQAAKYHSVPLMVCTALYKLCPLYPADHDLELRSPTEIFPFEEVAGSLADVTVINPAWDYIPPELVSLFITNSGGHNPTYIYRLLAEFYHPQDQQIV